MHLIKPFALTRGTSPTTSGYLISIDPGNCTGYACWSQHKPYHLIACGIGAPPYEKASRLVIEVPQVYPHGQVPPNDLITLAFMAGRYVGDFGGEAGYFLPKEWKSQLPKNVCENRCRMRLTAAELAVTVDAETQIPVSLRNNMWDAVGIGLVGYRGIKL